MENALAYGPQVLQGLLYTVLLTVCTVPFAVMVGVTFAAFSLAKSRLLNRVARVYAGLFRSIPELVILLFFYYGLSNVVSTILMKPVEFSPFTTGVVALSLISGSYTAEVLRGAVQAVSLGQTEAALSLGFRPIAAWIKIILPQAYKMAIAPLTNVLLILIKDTALASVVGIEELLRKSSIAAGSTHSPFIFFGGAAAIYLVASIPILVWQEKAEKKSEVAI
ncbi:amino acid ABC transporter permease [Aliirhizobium smilacinae]|uniref:ABC transporter permease subunit n=1 Tax=Aliirhizobium smilacinae TaxID=1395944 RepID=A0A5C4XAZ6_9HYPH|nr:ABC transporter permease subunit [Rhizobium smilacinae]TNM59910.1 ABC transporter permease subunit [Rhizobium smilacinae]